MSEKSEKKTNTGRESGLSPSSCYPIVRELRKLDGAVRDGNRSVALVIRAAANSLEKYEHLKDSVRDLQETLRDGSDPMDVKIAVAKLNGILG